jgi:hypothetical protein
MNVNQIDNIDRRCDSKLVRKSCAFQCGKNSIYDEAWSRWRSLCKVEPKAKKITDREAFLLLVCADMHRLKITEITYLRIVNEANKRLSIDPQSIGQIKAIASSTVKGSDLPKVLEDLTGRSVTTRTLYRWGSDRHMPKFSRNAEYSPMQLRLFLQRIDPNAA